MKVTSIVGISINNDIPQEEGLKCENLKPNPDEGIECNTIDQYLTYWIDEDNSDVNIIQEIQNGISALDNYPKFGIENIKSRGILRSTASSDSQTAVPTTAPTASPTASPTGAPTSPPTSSPIATQSGVIA